MKTIAFITRVKPRRVRMLKICTNSIKKQTNDDYIHIIFRDDRTKCGYGMLLANQSLARVSPIDARYVMVIDDDDMIIDSDFVKRFKEIVDDNNPEIVFFKMIIGNRLFPLQVCWKRPPIYNRIGGSCFATRLDIWKKYIHEFGRRTSGDFYFISACYKNTKNHFWFDHIVSKTQGEKYR